MWRAWKRGYQAEPLMLHVAFGLSLLSALPDALLALWFKLLADGVMRGSRALVLGAALGLGISTAATWFLRVMSDRTQRRFRDRLTIALESHVAQLQASVITVAHQECPEYLDRLAILRDHVFVLDHLYMSLFSTCGWVLRLVVTILLLLSVHPALGLLAVFALPTVFTSTWRPGIEHAAEERGAASRRLARHLFEVATTAPPGKEVRVIGIGDSLVRKRREAWESWYKLVSRARWTSAIWHTLAWGIFGAAYIGAVIFISSWLHGTAAQVLLVLAAGSRLSAYIGATVGEIGFLRGIWLEGSRRLAWLEDYAASIADNTDAPVPKGLVRGIRLEQVSFSYPGSSRRALENVNLELPAGRVVAIVGENGAGKSTLVKLLCRMYQPDSGRILVDAVDLARMPAGEWRCRLGGAFQDFFRFEFQARHSIGVGDVARLEDQPAVSAAVARAGAGDVIDGLPDGLQTQLGPTWPGGVELSFGQWQKLALARGFMRDAPLLLMLDEPTAALDAETEHALFERYAAVARGGAAPGNTPNDRAGRITLLVSHRFSTVRMADLIVVLDGARIVEVGGHEELLARRGRYAELYGIQAAAYRSPSRPRQNSKSDRTILAGADGSQEV
jgi:ATP-binding cassette subfamily B protein